MSQLGWLPGVDMGENLSGKFESRFSYVKIKPTQSIFFSQMEESQLGIWTAHHEGKFIPQVQAKVIKKTFVKATSPRRRDKES